VALTVKHGLPYPANELQQPTPSYTRWRLPTPGRARCLCTTSLFLATRTHRVWPAACRSPAYSTPPP
jgi:hypothetical protein